MTITKINQYIERNANCKVIEKFVKKINMLRTTRKDNKPVVYRGKYDEPGTITYLDPVKIVLNYMPISYSLYPPYYERCKL
jgi:hypothetical protein